MAQLPDPPKPPGRLKRALTKIVYPYGKREGGRATLKEDFTPMSRESKLKVAAFHNLIARGYDPDNAGRIVAGMSPEELRRIAYPADYS